MKTHVAVPKQLRGFLLPLLISAFLVLPMLLSASGRAQDMTTKKITLSLTKESLRNALVKVESLSGFRIAYPPDLVARYRNISLPKGTRTVKETIHLLLLNTPFEFRQQDEIIVIYREEEGAAEADTTVTPAATPRQQANTRTIIGSVTEARTNVSLPGVTVMVKGTNRGTQS